MTKQAAAANQTTEVINGCGKEIFAILPGNNGGVWTTCGADAGAPLCERCTERERQLRVNEALAAKVAELMPEGYEWTGMLTTDGHAVARPIGKPLDGSNARYLGPVAEVTVA